METIITIPRAVFCSARGVAAYPFDLSEFFPKSPNRPPPLPGFLPTSLTHVL